MFKQYKAEVKVTKKETYYDFEYYEVKAHFTVENSSEDKVLSEIAWKIKNLGLTNERVEVQWIG